MKKASFAFKLLLNVFILFSYLFLSGHREEIPSGIEHEYVYLTGDTEFDTIYSLADKYEVSLVFYDGDTTFFTNNLTYYIYNYEYIEKNIKYVQDDGTLFSPSPFNDNKVIILDDDKLDSHYRVIIVGESRFEFIAELTDYGFLKRTFSSSEFQSVQGVASFGLANFTSIMTLLLLWLVVSIHYIFSRKKKISILYTLGDSDFQISRKIILKNFKLHLLSILIVTVIPSIYIVLNSFSYFINFISYFIVINSIIFIGDIILIYLLVPNIIRSSNPLSVIKGKSIGKSLYIFSLVIMLFSMFVTAFNINGFSKGLNLLQYYNMYTDDLKDSNLYLMRHDGNINSEVYEIGPEDELYDEIYQYAYIINGVYTDTGTYTDDKELNLKFIGSDDNYFYINNKMFNFLEVEDVDGNIIEFDGTGVFIPESKFDDLYRFYSGYGENIYKVKDNQLKLGSANTSLYNYMYDAIYIVEKPRDVYFVPGQVNIFFHYDDLETVKNITGYDLFESVYDTKKEANYTIITEVIDYFTSFTILLIVSCISLITSSLLFIEIYKNKIAVYYVNGVNSFKIWIKIFTPLIVGNLAILFYSLKCDVLFIALLFIILQIVLMIWIYKFLLNKNLLLILKGD